MKKRKPPKNQLKTRNKTYNIRRSIHVRTTVVAALRKLSDVECSSHARDLLYREDRVSRRHRRRRVIRPSRKFALAPTRETRWQIFKISSVDCDDGLGVNTLTICDNYIQTRIIIYYI